MFNIETIFQIFVAVILLIYWGVAFVTLYHLTRFGIGVQPKRIAALFLLGSLVLSGIVFMFASSVDLGILRAN